MKVYTKRFSELDALRGISVFGVVLFHFTFGYDNGLHALSSIRVYLKYAI